MKNKIAPARSTGALLKCVFWWSGSNLMPTQQWHLLAPSLVQSFQVPCELYAPEENPSSQLSSRVKRLEYPRCAQWAGNLVTWLHFLCVEVSLQQYQSSQRAVHRNCRAVRIRLPMICNLVLIWSSPTYSVLSHSIEGWQKIRNEHYGIYRTEMVRKRMTSGTKHTEGHFSFAWILDKNPTPLWAGRNR